jgi:hypothetical protein
MTDNGIILKAQEVVSRLVDNGMSGSLSDWLIYGRALAYGKRIHPIDMTKYGRWVVSNGFGKIPGRLRSSACSMASNWDVIEPHTRIGQPLHGVNDPNKVYTYYAFKIMGKKSSRPVAKETVIEVMNGIDINVAIQAMDDIALAVTTMPSDSVYGSALIRAMDRLSTAVINAAKE